MLRDSRDRSRSKIFGGSCSHLVVSPRRRVIDQQKCAKRNRVAPSFLDAFRFHKLLSFELDG